MAEAVDKLNTFDFISTTRKRPTPVQGKAYSGCCNYVSHIPNMDFKHIMKEIKKVLKC